MASCASRAWRSTPFALLKAFSSAGVAYAAGTRFAPGARLRQAQCQGPGALKSPAQAVAIPAAWM